MNSNHPKTLNNLSMFQISISIKKLSILSLFILIGFAGFAQAPQLLHYQGVARNAFGNAYPNKTMTLRLSIRNGSSTGGVVYSETRSVKTNDGGLYTVEIGSTGALSTTGSMGAINWQNGAKFLQVEADPAAGNNFIDLGTTQFLSVPYAFGAGSAATVTTNANLTGVVTSVGNQTSIANGAITSDMIGTINQSKVGLGLVNNTSDVAKPISTATQAALDLKASVTQVNNLSTTLDNKLSIADSSVGYVTPTQLASKTFDQTPINNAISAKLAIADSTNGYVTPTQLASKTFDQTPINNAISGKLNIADSLTKYITPAQLAGYNFSSGGGSSNSNNSNLSFLAPLSSLGNDVSISAASGSVNGYLTATDFTNFSSKIDASQKAANNGVATLGNDGKIPSNQIPAVSFQSANVVSSQAAMLGISNAQVGSIAIRTDNNNNYVLSALPATNLSNWIQLATPTSVTSVNGFAGPSVALTTSDVAEGASNKYYTDARVRAALTASSPLVMDATNGNISMPFASASANGYLKATDFITFNNKQNTLNAGVDYLAPNGSAASLTNFPTLNQNTTGTAANVSGTVGVANGGTGATTLTGYIKGNGTSALVGISTIPVADVTGAAPLASPVFTGTPNLPTGTTAATQSAGDNSTKIATTAFVTTSLSAGAPDATSSSTGKIQLAGDLGGTATVPTVPGLSLKANTSDVNNSLALKANSADVTSSLALKANTSDVTSSLALKAPLASPVFTGTPSLPTGTTAATQSAGDNSTKIATTEFVTSSLSAGSPDATSSSTGKIQLAGDLSGTAAAPSIATGAINSSKILDATIATADLADGSVTDAKIAAVAGTKVSGNIAGNAANVTGTVTVANGGTGATTLSGIVKGNGTSAMTAAVAGTDYQAPISLTTTGSGAASLSGNTLNIPSTTNYTLPTASSSALGGVKVGTNLSIDGSGVLNANMSGKMDYTDTASLSSRINAKSSLSDTSLLNLTSRFDTKLNKSDTSYMLLGYRTQINNKLNWLDTTNMLSFYLRKSDTSYMLLGYRTQINNKLNSIDTTNMLSVYLRKSDNATTATLAGNITATTNTTLTSLASLNTVGTITSGTISLTTNMATSGTLKAGAVTYPNTHGTSGQVLTSLGSGTLSWTTASSGGIPYTGATGAVNLGGYDLTVNGLTIGTGYVNPANTYNTIVGRSALNRTGPGQDNTAIGYKAIGEAGITTTGDKNTAVGSWTLINNTGQENTAMGVGALQQNQGGGQNTAMGTTALQINTTGSNNTAVGYAADVVSNNLSNATAIGNGAKVATSNTIQLGNTSVTNVKTSGTLTAGTVTYPNTHGTSGQVLTSLASGTLSWTTVSSGGGLPTTGNTAGDMLYWNGTAWVKLAAGSNGQKLIFIAGAPKWIGTSTTTVQSTTGRIWMDRNLGATQVATSSTDASSFGGLYQWGRGTDGHEIRTSTTTNSTSATDIPGNGSFITQSNWRTTLNDLLWQGVNGVNNPCPYGFRLPTFTELDAERALFSSQNSAGAFASVLKLPQGGFRWSSGSVDVLTQYWTSSLIGTPSTYARRFYFDSGQMGFGTDGFRGSGMAIRCIMD